MRNGERNCMNRAGLSGSGIRTGRWRGRRKRQSATGIRVKICAALIVVIVVLNAVAPSFLDDIRTKTGADRDHDVEQIASMAVSAFYDAKAAVSEAAEALARQEVKPEDAAIKDEIDLSEKDVKDETDTSEEDDEIK